MSDRLRESLVEMERVLSRRTFLVTIATGAGVAAVYDRFGPRLFGDGTNDPLETGLQIFGAFGRLVIPVDQDPGWATFEPEITEYGLDTYVRQVISLGNSLAFDGLLQAINAFNEIPPQIRFGPKFLDMSGRAQADYLTKVLSGSFEYDGVQDILSFGAIFMLLGVKQVFFLNFPRHRATPGAEYQELLGNTPRTGWDIMGFKGPVGPQEEADLRARSLGAPELPGVDWRNPWI
ncbi:MAG: hypothetical protein Kow001_08530 [Acidobacteriota bacterium]